MSNRILTLEQAAEVMQLKPETIRRYLKSGKLPGRKVGKQWRIAEDDLINLVSEPKE